MAHALSASDLLTLWELGARADTAARVRHVLTLALADAGSMSDLPLGQRDLVLLEVHRATFGPTVSGLVACTRCGTRVAFEVDHDQLTFDERRVDVAASPLDVRVGDVVVTARPPTVRDVEDASRATSVDAARRLLIARCVVAAQRNHESIAVDDLDDAVLEAVGEALVAADPQCEVRLDLTCGCCQAGWPVTFGIDTFLWSTIATEAARVLDDIHALADAYGWTETDTLALSPARRSLYVERASRG